MHIHSIKKEFNTRNIYLLDEKIDTYFCLYKRKNVINTKICILFSNKSNLKKLK